jgi:hypothetical protein
MSAASSNTLVPPLIRPYPSLPKKVRRHRSRLDGGVYVSGKHIGLAKREITMMVYGYYVFPKPSVHGFPTTADPADRSCRYLVHPPIVLSLAHLRGYQRAPPGGRGRCRRACECNPPPGPPPQRRRRAPSSSLVLHGCSGLSFIAL